MSKEKPELIIVTAISDEEISQLEEKVKLSKEENPQALILAKSPRANKDLIITLFAAGAAAWAKHSSPEEGPPEPPTK